MKDLMEIIKKNHLSKDDIIQEAEFVEEYGEWIHMCLFGYSADELYKAVSLME